MEDYLMVEPSSPREKNITGLVSCCNICAVELALEKLKRILNDCCREMIEQYGTIFSPKQWASSKIKPDVIPGSPMCSRTQFIAGSIPSNKNNRSLKMPVSLIHGCATTIVTR